MGQAKITDITNASVGKYDIELIKHPGKSLARLAAIAKRLTALNPLITAAEDAYDLTVTQLSTAEAVLDMAISQTKPGGKPAPVVAVPHWANDGNGTVTDCEVGAETQLGNYDLTCTDTVASPASGTFSVRDPYSSLIGSAVTGIPFGCSEMSFRINMGSIPYLTGDSFDIDITEENIDPNVDLTKAQADMVTAIKNVTKAKMALNKLATENFALLKEKYQLDSAMQSETRNNVWCIDKTINLTVNQVVGTAEINGVPTTILLTPGGTIAESLGFLQHVGVSTPSATFFNRAILPGWQKWKPTYRLGTIISIDYNENKCDVALDAAYSGEKGLSINQEGEAYAVLKAGISGWTVFCGQNPTHPLVTNTGNTQITMTEQLKADLKSVNSDVNNRNNYKSDTETYGKLEYWAIMSPGASGDCEDFALTKAQKLLDLGYPASAIKIEIGLTPKGVGHAWLIVQTTAGEYALDLGQKEPVSAGTLTYTDRRRQTGTQWYAAGVVLRGVGIYYMGGTDSALFFPGDRAVVKFQSQDWQQPRVIGFESNPRATVVNFFIGKSTSPFSEYARADISARCLRYFKTGPNANLNDLSNGRIKVLILPCPVRVLTAVELAAIQAFRNTGGRVALFTGDNRDKANEVLVQLGSKLEIMPTLYMPSDPGIHILSGYMVEHDAVGGAATLFWIPVEIRGWINLRQANWGTAKLKDFSNFGLAYNGCAAAMTYETFLKAQRATGYPLGFGFVHETAIIGPQTPDTWSVTWYQFSTVFPTGYVAPYTADREAWRIWLSANSAKLPYQKVADYGYSVPTIYTPYGTAWNLSSMLDAVDMFGPLTAYAEGENLIVAALKPSWLTEAIENPVLLDYYFHTQEFSDWMSTGLMPIHDFFQNGNTFQPWPPYVPTFYSWGGVDGDGSTLQGG